jgi:hypothetical protein
LTGITIKVVYGDPEKVRDLLGEHTAYVECMNLTLRQINDRLVRKALSFSKELEMLKASCAREDWVYNLTRAVKTSRLKVNDGLRRWQSRSPAMAAGLIDHSWTVKEPLMTVIAPNVTNTKWGDYPSCRLFEKEVGFLSGDWKGGRLYLDSFYVPDDTSKGEIR